MNNVELDYSKLINIKKIEKNYIYFKDNTKLHTDNFTFLDTFKSQEDLEDFDRKVKYIFRLQ